MAQMASPYDTDLDRNPANFQPLTPLSFLARAAAVYPDHPAVIHGARSFTYRDFYARARNDNGVSGWKFAGLRSRSVS